MKRKNQIAIALFCFCIGLSIAFLIQTNQKPTEKDTRDLWEIRTSLQEEQMKQQNLYKEIEKSEAMLKLYEEQTEQQQMASLKESIKRLKEQAGLTKKEGTGVILTIEPIFTEENQYEYPQITADLIHHLVNELNTYGATDIAIGNERIVNISPIRDVNEKVYVNNYSIGSLPIKLYVLSEEPSRLVDYVNVSESLDYFALENMEIHTETVENITLPKYDGAIDFEDVKVMAVEGEGEE
ncbi:DUF881 domain-containing protein [Gracilibacillus sp. YIM 98692]|uniref:DUF881 domain-containing protein n=1 Tax=Gracilibacillus sp. YIM 98692 TaxID=2663532 RepID=UPI0013D5D90E|nr:DUF881 domain-containing protein [Gracilibacillus sp. YIM 98692]